MRSDSYFVNTTGFPCRAVVAEGNPVTRRRLEAAGAEVHALDLREVGENGTGGVTCLTRPLLRA